MQPTSSLLLLAASLLASFATVSSEPTSTCTVDAMHLGKHFKLGLPEAKAGQATLNKLKKSLQTQDDYRFETNSWSVLRLPGKPVSVVFDLELQRPGEGSSPTGASKKSHEEVANAALKVAGIDVKC